MQTHNLKRNHKNKAARQVGRGSKRGKTSGRGTKGQNARAGRKKRPEIRDIIKKLPKLRGRGRNIFKSFQIPYVPINLEMIEKHFSAGDTVSPETLTVKGLIGSYKGRNPGVKILSVGELSKKFIFIDCVVSAGAKGKIEKAGGSITAVAVETVAKAPKASSAIVKK
jgi:large subunit ribosomal protein L15